MADSVPKRPSKLTLSYFSERPLLKIIKATYQSYLHPVVAQPTQYFHSCVFCVKSHSRAVGQKGGHGIGRVRTQ